MALIDELKDKRKEQIEEVATLREGIAIATEELAEAEEALADLDIAIAALEPAPAEPEAVLYSIDEQTCEPVDPRCGAPAEQAPVQLDEPEIPEGFTRWEGGPCPLQDGEVADVRFAGGEGDRCDRAGWHNCSPVFDAIIAYRIISQPANQSEDEPAEFISDLTGDPAIEPETGLHADPEPTELDAPASIVDDPELLAAVARAEATLQEAEPAYVGLQDPELDAEYDAMKEREKADKPKLHFSIFGERGNRKLEDVE